MTCLVLELVFVVDPKLIQNNFNYVQLLIHALNVYRDILYAWEASTFLTDFYEFNTIFIITGNYAFKYTNYFSFWKHVLNFQM